VAKKSLALE